MPAVHAMRGRILSPIGTERNRPATPCTYPVHRSFRPGSMRRTDMGSSRSAMLRLTGRLLTWVMTENLKPQTDDKTILILGGTGKTGRRVADRLTALGRPVRIGSRSAEPSFDWENPATWAAALDGIDAVYVTYYPDLAAPGSADAIRALADQGVASGGRQVVVFFGRGWRG